MFEDGNMSPADLSAVMNNGNGGSWSWLIIILFLFMFGNGGWGTTNKNAATTQDLADQFNFSALERQNNETVAAVRQGVYDTTSAIKDASFANLEQSKQLESMIAQNGFNSQQCCCETNRNIDAVKYDALLNTQNIMQNDCNNTQKILDAINGNRIADMQNQINQLQLASQLANVVRNPIASYNVGAYPYFYNGTTLS